MVRFEWDLIFHSNTSTSLKREKPDFDYYALKESYADKISWFFFEGDSSIVTQMAEIEWMNEAKLPIRFPNLHYRRRKCLIIYIQPTF